MNEQAWANLMDALSIGANRPTWEQLRAAYAEKHRHYHTAAHIDSCLALFAEHRDAAIHPAEVECAIWFHDSIYKPTADDNEQQSADWAVRFLQDNGGTSERCSRVRSLIMTTKHDALTADADARLLVDIDLAILGVDEASYAKFEKNVRREYRWVPGPLFRRGRRKILQSFLDRKQIYSTDAIRDRCEERARQNLERTLRTL